jgi:hypothetical protein
MSFAGRRRTLTSLQRLVPLIEPSLGKGARAGPAPGLARHLLKFVLASNPGQ